MRRDPPKDAAMTGTTLSSAGLDARRKKLLFRSWHRGMREMDLILGSFADAEIAGLTDAEIDQYEQLLDITDTELLPWVTGVLPIPSRPETAMIERVVTFRAGLTF